MEIIKMNKSKTPNKSNFDYKEYMEIKILANKLDTIKSIDITIYNDLVSQIDTVFNDIPLIVKMDNIRTDNTVITEYNKPNLNTINFNTYPPQWLKDKLTNLGYIWDKKNYYWYLPITKYTLEVSKFMLILGKSLQTFFCSNSTCINFSNGFKLIVPNDLNAREFLKIIKCEKCSNKMLVQNLRDLKDFIVSKTINQDRETSPVYKDNNPEKIPASRPGLHNITENKPGLNLPKNNPVGDGNLNINNIDYATRKPEISNKVQTTDDLCDECGVNPYEYKLGNKKVCDDCS